MYFALGAEAQMGLKGWPEVGDESLGAAIRAKDRGTRRAIGGQTKACFGGGTRLRRAARGVSLAKMSGRWRIHDAAGGPRA